MKVAKDLMVEIPAEFPAFHVTDFVTRARKLLREYILRELWIQDDNNIYIGYVDITDVLRITGTKSNVTVEGFVKEAVPVVPEASLEEIAVALRDAATSSIAVVNSDKKLIGIILLREVFPILINRHELRGKVEDYMTRQVVACKPDDTIQKVHALIVDSSYSAFPVARKNLLIGMVSRSDLLKKGKVRKSLGNASKTSVESIMTSPAISITTSEGINVAAQKMVRHDVSRLPVVDDGRLVGIIDRHDVLKGLILKG